MHFKTFRLALQLTEPLCTDRATCMTSISWAAGSSLLRHVICPGIAAEAWEDDILVEYLQLLDERLRDMEGALGIHTLLLLVIAMIHFECTVPAWQRGSPKSRAIDSQYSC